MPSRITRRRLVGWLARTASAAAALGLLRTVSYETGEAQTALAAGLSLHPSLAPATTNAKADSASHS